jgi:O-antigen/teichoic acid export membrane protein
MTAPPASAQPATLLSRALRGSATVLFGFGGVQAIRFGSNLVLTRLLFPEAFGLMAIVSVVIVGMTMFSDVGTGPSIMRSPRGDDPLFLDTAWVLQTGRGVVLWLMTWVIADPLARFYGEPDLAWLLPLAGVSLLFDGVRTTRIETENRHLRMTRITVVDLASQVAAVTFCIALAAIYREVWALAAAGIMGAAVRCLLSWTVLPGHSHRPRFERAAASELIGFGKWIFLSTIAGFLATQGDRLILGAYLTMGQLGVYNIGFFLASFVPMAAAMVSTRMLIPLYREVRESDDPEAWPKLRRMRMLFTAAMLLPISILAFLGVPLVDVLFDPRFATAGIIAAMLSCVQVVHVIMITYDQAALAAGDSRAFFFFVALRAALQVTGLIAGASVGGALGAIAGQGIAALLTYPAMVLLARRYGVYDLRHDLVFGAVGLVVTIMAVVANAEALRALAGS